MTGYLHPLLLLLNCAIAPPISPHDNAIRTKRRDIKEEEEEREYDDIEDDVRVGGGYEDDGVDDTMPVENSIYRTQRRRRMRTGRVEGAVVAFAYR
mmetsp:Transcript_5846/g.8232  ORF Transcript_5846/g.8232 Transcript_5846/m.8232 type:complete len:96 (-) Transcript_5846:163-450(-)